MFINRSGSVLLRSDDPGADVPTAPGLAGAVEAPLADGQLLALQHAALENTANAVVITDLHGTIQWTNPAFTTLTGYAAAEAVRRTPALLKSGEHDRPYYDKLWRTITAGQTWRGEFTNRRKDGTLYRGEQVITPVRAAGAGITHFVAVMNDITERKRTEAALRESEALYQALVEQMPAGVFRKDAEGRYVYVNAKFARLAGLPPAEHLGRTPAEIALRLVARDPLAPGMAEVATFFNQGAAHHVEIMRTSCQIEREHRWVFPDGHTEYLHVLKGPVFDSAGGLAGSQGILFDVTARKEAELRLKLQHAVTQVLAEGGALEQTTRKILETIGGGLDWDLGEYWKVDRTAQILRCAVTWQPEAPVFRAFAGS